MRVLVTGGSGFLGSALARHLHERGFEVINLSLAPSPVLDQLGIKQIDDDLGCPRHLNQAIAGCDLVFHTAAKAGIWGPYEAYHQANVTATEQVIAACQTAGVKALVHTSSPSVVFDGESMEGADESVPYPSTYLAPYPQTKALAEKKIVHANSAELLTVALRPHLIWGPGDNHLVPRILAQGKAGRLRRVGKGDGQVDTTYIDNAVRAHWLAAKNLLDSATAAGKVYFISDGQPVSIWWMINQILATAQLPPVDKTVPTSVAYGAGALLEKIYTWARLEGEPRMTRFVAKELSTSHWFDISAAQRDLGYSPQVDIPTGLSALRTWLSTKAQT